MTQRIYEGTPQELAPVLAKRPQGRFRLIELQDETGPIEEALDAKLRLWQQQDGTPLLPDIPAHALFAQWAEEDARMTDAEREAEALVAGHGTRTC